MYVFGQYIIIMTEDQKLCARINSSSAWLPWTYLRACSQAKVDSNFKQTFISLKITVNKKCVLEMFAFSDFKTSLNASTYLLTYSIEQSPSW